MAYASKEWTEKYLGTILKVAKEEGIFNNYLGIDRYTDKEICIGEYMGKPLYRQTIERNDTLVGGANTDVTIDFTNIDNVVNTEVMAYYSASKNWRTLPFAYSLGSTTTNEWFGGYYIFENTLRFQCGSKFANGCTKQVIVLEYTKTTDADGSFDPAMIGDGVSVSGVAYIDYSEEERVIGKWVNGKPVYRKVYPATIPATTKLGTFAISYVPLDNDLDSVISWSGRLGSQPMVYITNTGEQLKTYVELAQKRLAISNSNTNFNNQTGYIVVEYTKSTDAPNSFKPSMVLGGVSIEEASDEDVKEVW